MSALTVIHLTETLIPPTLSRSDRCQIPVEVDLGSWATRFDSDVLKECDLPLKS